MTVYTILRGIDTLGYLEAFCNAKVINKSIIDRYKRYSYYLEQKTVFVNEKHYTILVDVAIHLNVSIQTLYEDIRVLETQI